MDKEKILGNEKQFAEIFADTGLQKVNKEPISFIFHKSKKVDIEVEYNKKRYLIIPDIECPIYRIYKYLFLKNDITITFYPDLQSKKYGNNIEQMNNTIRSVQTVSKSNQNKNYLNMIEERLILSTDKEKKKYNKGIIVYIQKILKDQQNINISEFLPLFYVNDEYLRQVFFYEYIYIIMKFIEETPYYDINFKIINQNQNQNQNILEISFKEKKIHNPYNLKFLSQFMLDVNNDNTEADPKEFLIRFLDPKKMEINEFLMNVTTYHGGVYISEGEVKIINNTNSNDLIITTEKGVLREINIEDIELINSTSLKDIFLEKLNDLERVDKTTIVKYEYNDCIIFTRNVPTTYNPLSTGSNNNTSLYNFLYDMDDTWKINDIDYELNSFVMYEDSGFHYTCYLKKNNKWNYCNNLEIKKVDNITFENKIPSVFFLRKKLMKTNIIEPPILGIPNIGSICSIISSMQCLMNIPEFLNYIVSNYNSINTFNKEYIDEFQNQQYRFSVCGGKPFVSGENLRDEEVYNQITSFVLNNPSFSNKKNEIINKIFEKYKEHIQKNNNVPNILNINVNDL